MRAFVLAVLVLSACGPARPDPDPINQGDVDAGPTSDAGLPDAGEVDDPDAGEIDAGEVDAGEPVCRPLTCGMRGFNCGEIDDGCGAKVACGTCSGGQTCGGSGTTNVCGGKCGLQGCPAGWTCGDDGVCRGGDRNNLVIDVKTIPFSGRFEGVHEDDLCSFCWPTLRFTRLDAERPFGGPITHEIRSNYPDFTISGRIPPGRYKVEAIEYSSSGPDWLVEPSFVIEAPVSDYVVRPQEGVWFSGEVTFNGAAPTPACQMYREVGATILFRHHLSGELWAEKITCDDRGNWGYDFYNIPAGRYRVAIVGDEPEEDSFEEPVLPLEPFVIAEDVVVADGGQDFDLGMAEVSGAVTENGAAKDCSFVAGNVAFKHLDSEATFRLPVTCRNGNWGYSGQVYKGAYEVRVGGTAGISSSTASAYRVFANLMINGPMPALDVDEKTARRRVSGRVTVNGTRGAYALCDGGLFGLQFEDAAQGHHYLAFGSCSSDWNFDAELYEGRYTVTFKGGDTLETYRFPGELEVNQNRANLAFDVKQVRFQGRIAGLTSCDGAEYTSLYFVEKDAGYVYSIDPTCTGAGNWTFDTMVAAGRYEVSFVGPPLDWSDYVWPEEDLTSDRTNVVLEPRLVDVAGTYTVDGQAPATFCVSDSVGVSFVEASGSSSGASGACVEDAPVPFTGTVFPGVQSVSLSADFGEPSFPFLPLYEKLRIE